MEKWQRFSLKKTKKTQQKKHENFIILCVEMAGIFEKIGLRSDLSWPKLGLEPKCHDPVTFGGFGKQITTNIHIHVL